MKALGTFPKTRLRRNRRYSWVRDLCQENRLDVGDLIWPIFVRETEMESHVANMPDIRRYSVDELPSIVDEATDLGIPAIAVFPCLDTSQKDDLASRAFDIDTLVVRALEVINKHRDREKLGIIVDVALDPYTSHGHDGLLDSQGFVDNDQTLNALQKQALLLAKAGADIVAPSDMMDGRVAAIRRILDEAGFLHVGIMSYAAKYNSAFYGPFRSAVKSLGCLKGASKLTYQMNPANGKEALREIALDIEEGADSIIVKPGMCYLDVMKDVSQRVSVPMYAYQVSGEYTMIKLAAKHADMNEDALVMESLLAFKRAGCCGILTYFAPKAARLLQN